MKARRLRELAVALFAALLVLCAPVAAQAAEGDVARICEREYETFADAADAVQDGETIELLQDCDSDLTSAWAIDAIDVTISGNHTLTFTDYSFGINGNGVTGGGSLTLDGCKVTINSARHTAYSDRPSNAAILLNNGGCLILDNGAVLTVDDAEDGIATWTNGGSVYESLIVRNGSKYEYRNSSGLAFENYGASGSARDKVEVTGGSTLYAHDSYGGLNANIDVLVDASTLTVTDNDGYGSNGPYYTFTNNAQVLFDGNGDWGISAYSITMNAGASLVATDNGRSGVWVRILNVDTGCTLDVERNGYSFGARSFGTTTSSTSNAGITFWGNGSQTSTIAAGAFVTIKDNAGSGISARQRVSNLTILSGTITNNGLNADGEGADYGGGVFVRGTMTIGENVEIYNNHAEVAGDDIFVRSDSEITFPSIEADCGWALDGEPDCFDGIDGWYLDGVVKTAEGGFADEVTTVDENEQEVTSAAPRWDAHVPAADVYAEKLEVSGQTTVTGLLALKATHGVSPTTVVIEGTKTLAGRSMAEGEFSFVLRDSEGNEIETVSNAADGTFKFPEISYGLADAGNPYIYTVSEVIPDDAVATINGEEVTYEEAKADGLSAFEWTKDGVTYDTSAVTVTVEVVYAEGPASMGATVSYAKDGEQATGVAFTNSYAPAPVTSEGFVAKKVLEGAALAEGQFSFQLLDSAGNVVETVKNDADGYVRFAGIEFNAAGTYEYTLVEVNDGQQGVTYDDRTIGLYVDVKDNGDGTLTAVSLAKEEPVFTNTYTKPAAPAAPQGTMPATGDTLPTTGIVAAIAAAGIAVVAGARAISKRRG